MRQRDGFEVRMNLLEMGIRRERGVLADVECVLFPSDPEWTSFQAIARDYGSWSLLHWKCSADLCRLGFPSKETAEVAFPAVPPGAYDLYVRYRLEDGSGSRTLRIRASEIVVRDDGQVDASDLQGESREIRAVSGLENVM